MTRRVNTAPMRDRATSHIRGLAKDVHDAFPEMDVHEHLTDAARELDSGRTHSATRHMHAAIFHLTPLQLRRHGVHDDGGHEHGKAFMQRAHRGLLLTKDFEDAKAANRQPPDDDTEAEAGTPPGSGQPPPNSSAANNTRTLSWDDHCQVIELVAQHESAAGRRKLQAKGHTAYGTSYPVPNVSYWHKAMRSVGRVAPGKRGVLKRFLKKRAGELGISTKGTWVAAANPAGGIDLSVYGIKDQFIDLAGPKGYIHGWIYVGAPGTHPPKGEIARVRKAAGITSKNSVAALMSGFPAREQQLQQESGIWGQGRTYAQHTADVGRLSPEQKAAYIKSNLGGTSPYEALRTAQRLPTGGNAGRLSVIGPEPSKGSLGAKWKPVDVASGAGMPLEPQATYERQQARQTAREAEQQDRHARAMAAYSSARQDGHPHNKALAIARRAFGAVGRALAAGSAVPPASKGKLGAAWKPSKADRRFEPQFLTHPSRKQAQAFASMFSWGEVLDAIELVGPKGYTHGWHYVGGPGLGPPTGPKGRHAPVIGKTVGGESGRGPISIGVGREPGSLEHVRAIWDLGTLATRNTTDMRPSSDTLGNALHNVARSVAQRDMHSARIHMQSARWANDHEAGGAYTAELDDLDRQLRQVPRGVQPLSAAPANPLSVGYKPPLSATPYQPTRGATQELNPAGGWSQYANDNSSYHLELSAQTGRLAVTPAPRGRPGGPGLYDVKGMGHSPYLQNIVKALIKKRGMEPGKAYAIARSSIRKWSRGGGHVHPEVRTAAGAAEADELAKQARAKMQSHANTPWGAVELAIELFNPAGNPSQARTPQGQAGGGQFTAGGGGQQSQQKGKTPAKAPAKPVSGANAQAKASLRTTIAQQMAQLNGMRGILQQMNAGKITPSAASSAVSKLSKGSTPAKKGAAATSAKGVAAAKAGAAATAAASSTATKTASATAKKTVLTKASEAKAITSKISALAKQIAANRAALAKL